MAAIREKANDGEELELAYLGDLVSENTLLSELELVRKIQREIDDNLERLGRLKAQARGGPGRRSRLLPTY